MNWRTLIVAGYMNRYGNGFTKMDLRDSTSMRNYELIKAIYDRCPDMAKYPKGYTIDQIFDRTQDIIDLIELHRPELKKEK